MKLQNKEIVVGDTITIGEYVFTIKAIPVLTKGPKDFASDPEEINKVWSVLYSNFEN